MSQKGTSYIFDAEARSVNDLYLFGGGTAGFRIPIYQRQYDWGEGNIKRLFEDILSGLAWRSEDEDSLSFLGTIIVIEESRTENTFDGISLSVIDGQQRLTTLSIVACNLYEQLQILKKPIIQKEKSFQNIPNNVHEWLNQEVNHVMIRLLNLAYGKLQVDGVSDYPFPRVVREESDFRANSFARSDYSSNVAKYLNEFSLHIKKGKADPFSFNYPKSQNNESFKANITAIKKLIKHICKPENELSDDISIELLKLKDFEKAGIKRLFYKLPIEQSKSNKILSYCKEKGENLLDILRLITFSTFLMDAVIITIVKARDEKYGFDIFDSLNTTGEPLTAVQTFKPQVVNFEKEKGNRKYKGSESERYFNRVEQYLDNFSSNYKKQKEAKDLIVPFALYINGDKRSRSLDDQRRYLRSNFEKIKGKQEIENKRRFICKLSEVAEYKEKFWLKDNIESELSSYPDREIVLLCLKFLQDLNNSLTIPILCRYYHASIEIGDKKLFSDAAKAISAFVILRRSVTGGTAGIDSDLRALMSYGRRKKEKNLISIPLCVGLERENPIVEIASLREYLREWLNKKRIEIKDKTTWISQVVHQPLYPASTHLCRFLLLAASHNARPHKDEPWKLTKQRKSPETEFLSYQRWVSDDVATVEHIAPESGPSEGWDKNIYSQPYLKNCLGNLTLLPQEENSAVGNKPWQQKKLLYEAYAAETFEEVEKVIQKSKEAGFNFSKRTKEMLKTKASHIPLAKTISSVDKWTKKVIEERSKNIAELAWEEISPWLFEQKK